MINVKGDVNKKETTCKEQMDNISRDIELKERIKKKLEIKKYSV